MAEASFNKSLTYPNGNEMTKSEIEVAEQLIQLRMISKRKDMMTLEEELQVDEETITKTKSQPKNHQKKKMKFRSLVDIYKMTTPI
ncbi:hypothetical protein QL285_064570 [Trifolium repens]|jgi:hypothetical protein|nr:hypothetical protein QL285_064570 [Trifolium repens]